MSEIIFLNGSSSAGKTTLARALRPRLPRPFCYYASDQLADAGFRATPRSAAERQRFFDGFHRSIGGFADAGNDLLVEHIIEQAAWASQLGQILAAHRVLWIGVHASLEELERRERERGDRTIGEARFHLRTHGLVHYDLEVHAEQPLELRVERIVALWQARQG